MQTLNNRFLVSLFFKPLDKLLVSDFPRGASPRSHETFLQNLCVGCSTRHLSWWKGQILSVHHSLCGLLLLQHYLNLQICTANKQMSKKEPVCSTLQDHSTTKSNLLSLLSPLFLDLMPVSQVGLQLLIFLPPSRCT